MTEDWQAGGFALYLHWPFCQAKCPYCDFNSHVSRQIDQSQWKRAYIAEIERYAAETSGRVLTSVFFGGGTPSLMDPDVVAAVLDAIGNNWTLANDIEITLEANPGSVEAGRFKAYGEAGVNRISMGIQALDDRSLRQLGRIHTVTEAMAAFDTAREQFERVSFDLIYARQDQNLSAWKSELRQAVNMAVDHLSLYQLTIERGTAFGDRYKRGRLRGLPDDELSADMYEATQEICNLAGLWSYEISNHARTGSESRHNRVYWRYGDYVGIGPGAHGRLTLEGRKFATEGWRDPQKWLKSVTAGQSEKCRTEISLAEQADEFLMMGLRLSEGIDPQRYARLAGRPLPPTALDKLVDLGMIEITEQHIRVADKGRMVLNAIIRELLPE